MQDAEVHGRPEYRPCQPVWVPLGGSWRSGALALCFFVPAQVLEGQTPSFQTFDLEGGGRVELRVGLTINCDPCPGPALPCPGARPVPTRRLGNCLAGRLAGWQAGWTDCMEGWASGWVEGSTSGQEWSPAQSTRCFSPHQAKRGLGLETRVGEDEKKGTAHVRSLAVSSPLRSPPVLWVHDPVPNTVPRYLPT